MKYHRGIDPNKYSSLYFNTSTDLFMHFDMLLVYTFIPEIVLMEDFGPFYQPRTKVQQTIQNTGIMDHTQQHRQTWTHPAASYHTDQGANLYHAYRHNSTRWIFEIQILTILCTPTKSYAHQMLAPILHSVCFDL